MTDLITLDTDYSKDLTVYRLMKGWQKIHEDYGLWICAGKSGSFSTVHQKPNPRYFEFYTISHLVKGHGWLWIEGEGTKTFEAGQAVIMGPGIVHDYNGFDSYVEDFVCFTGTIADQLLPAHIQRP